MSDYATINLLGKSTKQLLTELDEAQLWGGDEHLVKVSVGDHRIKYEEIDTIRKAIKDSLWKYIDEHFTSKKHVLKSGGNDDLYLIPNPDRYNDEGKFHKVRHKPTNLTAKKKKRK